MARGEVTGRKPRLTADKVRRSGPPIPADDEIEPTPHDAEIEPRPHAEPKPTKAEAATHIRGPPMAYSIRQFCALHDISIDTYFRMQRDGEGPDIMKVGHRTLISAEAAAAWRRSREAAAKEQRSKRTKTITAAAV